ncbi:MAG: 4a-hydroxytetrahydrobiopterin dehydratase [Candidatus ainarchaeum sp.]|nr:4a-hydroxytetrahydrobiopterin dehydratase [Candidatus ainarchaeum sp.]
MAELASKKCVPCQIGAPVLSKEKAEELLKRVSGWAFIENAKKIQKTFEFRDFAAAMKFLNKAAEIAEKEGHHPDFFVSYNKITFTLFTHKINGLHENDFILAAKMDKIKKDND